MFDEKIIAAHCVWLDENDINIMKDKNVGISHNPTSNLKLASGIAPVPSFMEKELIVGIGTDGAASNNNLDLLEETRLAALLYKGTSMNPEVMDAQTMINMLTINGAKALGLSDITGSIEKGKRADMILINRNSAENIPSYDYYSTIIYSTNSSTVNTVIIDGRIIMLDKELKTINESNVFKQVRELKKQIKQ
jgi:5-methylthioadenosine/S-adenosylhomocysteine deaminase